jgi:hypothetical protein
MMGDVDFEAWAIQFVGEPLTAEVGKAMRASFARLTRMFHMAIGIAVIPGHRITMTYFTSEAGDRGSITFTREGTRRRESS